MDDTGGDGDGEPFAPGLPSSYEGLRGRDALGRARIDHHLVEITRLWHSDNQHIAAKLGRTGNFGGSGGLIMSLDALRLRAEDGVKAMLEEIAKAVRDRMRLWHRLHLYAEKRLREHLSVCAGQAVQSMWRGDSKGRDIAEEKVEWIIKRLQAEILMHKEGWTAPQPDSLEDRYPILSKVALAIFAFALGVIAGPISSTVFPETGDLQGARAVVPTEPVAAPRRQT